MFLRTSISTTKKFFQKTLENFKCLISGGYQKLPKSPPCKPFLCDGQNWSINSDLSNQLYSEKNEKIMKNPISTSISRHEDEDIMMKNAKVSQVKNQHHNHQVHKKEKKIVHEGKIIHQKKPPNSDGIIQRRNYLVAQKLKELEMMDKSNVEHVLDIEEVLHYYSRLTCSSYRDIVDKFFMDMYSELFRMQASSNNNLIPRLQKRKPKFV